MRRDAWEKDLDEYLEKSHIDSLHDEINKLEKENDKLIEENEKLKEAYIILTKEFEELKNE